MKLNPNMFTSTALLHMYRKAVSSLAMATTGSALVSSSEDCSCRVWDMNSRQTLQVVSLKGEHERERERVCVCVCVCVAKGAVTGLLLHTDVWGLNSGKVVGRRDQWRLPLAAFKKQLHYSSGTGQEWGGELVTVVPKEGVHPVSEGQ